MAVPLYTVTGNVCRIEFLHILANTCHFLFQYIIAILVDVKWYLMALTPISLMANEAEHPVMCCDCPHHMARWAFDLFLHFLD